MRNLLIINNKAFSGKAFADLSKKRLGIYSKRVHALQRNQIYIGIGLSVTTGLRLF